MSAAVLVVSSMVALGYAFGVEDQLLHLVFIERASDASYLAGDPLVDSAVHHPSLLWPLFGALSRLISLEALFLGVHLLTVAATFCATAALTRSLWSGPAGASAGIVAAAMIFLPKGPFGGIATWDNMVLNRTIALGPLLFALGLGARGRFPLAFLLSGVIFDFHPTSGVHALILLVCGALASHRHRRHALTGPLYFFLAASPLGIRMLMTGATSGVPCPAPVDWLDAQRSLVWFHHFPSTWPAEYWCLLVPSLVAVVIGIRAGASGVLPGYLAGIALSCFCGFVGVEWLRIPSALHLHLQETLRLVPFLAAASLGGWAVARLDGSSREKLLAIAGIVALAFDQFFNGAGRTFWYTTLASLWLLLLVAILDVRLPRVESARARAWASLPLTIGFVLLLGCAGFLKYRPSFQWTYDDLPESRVTRWIRDNLPADAVIAVPPDYAPIRLNVRWAARRRVITTLKDGSETTFSLSLFQEWCRRMDALIGRPLDFPAGRGGPSMAGTFEWIGVVLRDYNGADAKRFRNLAVRYGATHAIVNSASPTPPRLPLLYEDSLYRVYRIPG